MLCRVNFVLTRKYSLFRRGYILINVRKDLSIDRLYMYSHVIFIKNSTEMFHIVTKGMCRHFNIRRASTGLRWWEQYMAWVSSSLIFMFSAHTTTPLRWDRVAALWEHNPPCYLLNINMYHRQRGLGRPLGFWEYRLCTDCRGWRPGRNVVAPLFLYLEEWTVRPQLQLRIFCWKGMSL
jgi:hypothetical protein